MTSPIKGKTSADDGAPSDDDVPLASGADEQAGAEEQADEKPPSSAPFLMLGSTDAEACGPDGCCQS